MIYYLAGPMAGYPAHNHPAFHAAAAQLRRCGHKIINPAEYGNLVTGWQECMKRDIHALLWCDAVIVLPGWENSRGATLETDIARRLEMPIYALDVMLCDCISVPNELPDGLRDLVIRPWHTESCLARRESLQAVEDKVIMPTIHHD